MQTPKSTKSPPLVFPIRAFERTINSMLVHYLIVISYHNKRIINMVVLTKFLFYSYANCKKNYTIMYDHDFSY